MVDKSERVGYIWVMERGFSVVYCFEGGKFKPMFRRYLNTESETLRRDRELDELDSPSDIFLYVPRWRQVLPNEEVNRLERLEKKEREIYEKYYRMAQILGELE